MKTGWKKTCQIVSRYCNKQFSSETQSKKSNDQFFAFFLQILGREIEEHCVQHLKSGTFHSTSRAEVINYTNYIS